MADYIYLLQTRLNAAQLASVEHVRTAARARGMTVFLVGGAVRDLTSGAPVRDLDLAVQGDALKLRKDLEKAGGTLLGENAPAQALYFSFPGGVRLEVSATLSATYAKPGKPTYKSATILEDLRRRDFTANSMAISLNEGSYGLLMDPLNGIADLENRELRLVSNYGFIEDPSLLVRATRFSARMGWTMEEKTRQRYETAKTENYIAALNAFARAYELEEVFHEEDPLRVLQALEAEGWSKALFPAWTSKHVNAVELERLRDTVGQIEAMGLHPDPSAALFVPLTAKLAPKDVTVLKRAFARPGFADQIAALEPATKAFAAVFTGKTMAEPSATWKLLYGSEPEPILWLAHTSKAAAVQNKFKAFFTEWPLAKNKIPYQLMQEMRIVPELPIYKELLDNLVFAIMDGKLDTVEATRAFLEPYSPPAPPPPVNLRRRAVKRETKPAKRAKKVAAPIDPAEQADLAAAAETPSKIPPAVRPVSAAPKAPAPKAPAPKAPARKAPAPKAPAPKPSTTQSVSKPVSRPKPAPPAKPVATRPAPARAAAKPVAAKTPAKSPAKKAAPAPVKRVAKAPKKKAASHLTKPVPKKSAAKPAAKKPTRSSKPAPKKPMPKVAAKKPRKVVAKVATKKPLAKKPSRPSHKPATKTKTRR